MENVQNKLRAKAVRKCIPSKEDTELGKARVT